MGFEGGERLKNHLKHLQKLRKPGRVEVGFFEPSIASIALYMEYGFVNARGDGFVPPRPFFRRAIHFNRDSWKHHFGLMMAGGMSSKEALNKIGKLMKNDITYYLIASWSYRANMPATVKKKGFDKPLFETGRFQKAVKLKVVMGAFQP